MTDRKEQCPRCGGYGFGCYECTPADALEAEQCAVVSDTTIAGAIAEAFDDLLRSPMGSVPDSASAYYDGKTGHFSADRILSALHAAAIRQARNDALREAAEVAKHRELVCRDADEKGLGDMEKHCALEARHIADKILAMIDKET